MIRSTFTSSAARAVLGVALIAASMMTLSVRTGHAASASVQADARFTQAESDAFVRKMAVIERIGAAGPASSAAAAAATAAGSAAAPAASAGSSATARARPGQARLTTISERELNAYLRYDMREAMPAGVTEPTITILGDGRLTATAVVDLDEVRDAQTGWLNPMRLLKGRLPITASGVLESQHGTARFVLDAADVSGVTVPKALLQQVVSFYSRTAENPDGVDLDAPIELPAGIQEIRVQPGQAIVVQ
jgi:hypothetical protein